MEINTNRLRTDLKDYYGTVMFGGFPIAVMEVDAVERASDDELMKLAEKVGIDIQKYYDEKRK